MALFHLMEVASQIHGDHVRTVDDGWIAREERAASEKLAVLQREDFQNAPDERIFPHGCWYGTVVV